jgi:L,D-transpeptidase catalytic domain
MVLATPARSIPGLYPRLRLTPTVRLAQPPVIRPEQLAQALDRLDPRDRELLSLSLHRRVPDDSLARVYACEPAEVARRRAHAIERLADEMELQRGEDLGAVLQALLAPDTWKTSGVGEEFAAGAGGGRLAPIPRQDPPEPSSGVRTLAAVPPPAEEPEEPKSDEEADPATVIPVHGEPVLERLAEREREVPDPPRRAVPLALIGLGLAALVGAAGLVGATQFGDSEPTVPSEDDGTRHFVPERGGPLAAPFPTDPNTASCYSTAYVRRASTLYDEPGGRKRLTLTRRTEWGSPRILGVVGQRGAWLGVQAPELRNGEVGWLRREEAGVDCVRWSLHVDLSRRVLFVRRDGHTVRKLAVAVGRPGNRTPEGRFTITDKLRVTDPASAYGCCVLALSGHQTHLPPDWPGGDRLAVHATRDLSSIGRAVSLGCMRARAGQARWLIETVPLGAPIFIRA